MEAISVFILIFIVWMFVITVHLEAIRYQLSRIAKAAELPPKGD